MTSDICTIEDIHPWNKQDVGLRLANVTLKQHYKVLDKEMYGPLLKSAIISMNQIEVEFIHKAALRIHRKKLDYFELSNEDGKWFPAKANIRNGVVLVSVKEVKNLKAVRYAWGSTALVNLFNGAGLLACICTSE